MVSFLGCVSVLMFLDSRNWAHQQKLLDFQCACVRDNFYVCDCKAAGVVYAIEHKRLQIYVLLNIFNTRAAAAIARAT